MQVATEFLSPSPHKRLLTCGDHGCSPIAPARAFKALILNGDNLIPKLCHKPSRELKSYKEMEGSEPSRRSTLQKALFAYLSQYGDMSVVGAGTLTYLKHHVDEINK
ncbi:unnamed protein product [Thlaspi arvense]|uniref:Uncharacterized protein n=1 Tax=Thlaspi arvense TaxID=13288 RepID=A0AAU9TCR7_THLAR|nr:unnamed protein product [Thlaspi arvense]